MRGRKPQPTFLKLVKNTRKSRINPAEALPPRDLPSPPAHLSDEAKVEWGRVSEALYNAGLLSTIDRGILGAYCQAYGRWVIAEELLAKQRANDPVFQGLVSKTFAGNAIVSPLLGIANKAMADMARYSAELGMTPSARSRVTAKPPLDASDEADQYFR